MLVSTQEIGMRPEEAGRLLGIEPPNMGGCRSLEEAGTRLQTWKETTLRQAYRREARKWHPDKARADVTECTARVKLVNEAREVLSKLEAVPTRPRPAPGWTRVVIHGNPFSSPFGGSATTSGTNTSTGGFRWHRH